LPKKNFHGETFFVETSLFLWRFIGSGRTDQKIPVKIVFFRKKTERGTSASLQPTESLTYDVDIRRSDLGTQGESERDATATPTVAAQENAYTDEGTKQKEII